jgi:serine/threonine protein phosphatase PrpC
MKIYWGAATKASPEHKDGVNQDSIAIAFIDAGPQGGNRIELVACIADGMGALDAPAVASATVIRSALTTAFSEVGPAGSRVCSMIVRANDALLAAAGGCTLGSTLTSIILSNGKLYIGHVGDNRLYRIRGSKWDCLTVDHSRLAQHLGEKNPSREMVKKHKSAKNLIKSLGERPFDVTYIHTITVEDEQVLKQNDSLVLCSDGVWTEISEEELVEIVQMDEPQTAAERLVEFALERDHGDDCSVIVIRCYDAALD